MPLSRPLTARPISRARGRSSAVAAVKRDPALTDAYRRRIADIDRAAFERWALLTVPAGVGTALMVVGTLVGLGFVWAAYGATELWCMICPK